MAMKSAEFCSFLCSTILAFWYFDLSSTAVDSITVAKTIVVDKSGVGNFTTVQSALDSIPSDSKQWIRILVKPAMYWEQVNVTKPYILLEGDANKRPTICWNNSIGLLSSPTFHALADNFVAKWVNFENSYNYRNKTSYQTQTAALQVSGDKSAFYECGFYSVQDTLWDDSGRHYFKGCHIEGLVDFIFGAGQSIYEACNITVLPGSGYITAQARNSSNETDGFVFKSCSVEGKGKAYLGRPWRTFARVLFFKSYLSSVVFPEGWDRWNDTIVEDVTFAEYGCFGEGANTLQRVKWEKTLNEEQLHELTSLSYIDKEGWLEQQP